MIKLEPMSPSDYAKDKVENGTWLAEDSLKNAEAEFVKLLPKGLETPNEFLWNVVDEDQIVGILWAHHDPAKKSFFVYDILIYDKFQNKGYGQQTLAALDDEARKLGVTKIGLHVFGSNHRALHVYEKMGFVVTDVEMMKTIGPSSNN